MAGLAGLAAEVAEVAGQTLDDEGLKCGERRKGMKWADRGAEGEEGRGFEPDGVELVRKVRRVCLPGRGLVNSMARKKVENGGLVDVQPDSVLQPK